MQFRALRNLSRGLLCCLAAFSVVRLFTSLRATYVQCFHSDLRLSCTHRHLSPPRPILGHRTLTTTGPPPRTQVTVKGPHEFGPASLGMCALACSYACSSEIRASPLRGGSSHSRWGIHWGAGVPRAMVTRSREASDHCFANDSKYSARPVAGPWRADLPRRLCRSGPGSTHQFDDTGYDDGAPWWDCVAFRIRRYLRVQSAHCSVRQIR